jgi:hypothetical protein
MGKSIGGTFRSRMAALNDRADFLKARIADNEAAGTGNHYDRAEYAAIVWAINFIEEYPDEAVAMIKGQGAIIQPKKEVSNDYI